MDTPTLVLVPRQTDSLALPELKPVTLHWRKIVLLLAPLLLAAGNLIEAHFEKLRAFQVGANKYLEFKGRGEAVRDAAIRAAIDKGQARYVALIAEAQNQARADIRIGQRELETKTAQGKDVSAIPDSLAHGMILAMFGKTREIARLVHERSELEIGARYGRYLKVDYKTGRFELRELASNEQSHAEMRERLWSLRSIAGHKLDELEARVITDGARELATFAGAGSCGSN